MHLQRKCESSSHGNFNVSTYNKHDPLCCSSTSVPPSRFGNNTYGSKSPSQLQNAESSVRATTIASLLHHEPAPNSCKHTDQIGAAATTNQISHHHRESLQKNASQIGVAFHHHRAFISANINALIILKFDNAIVKRSN
ncbi:hypothetical protein DEO72_LG3g1367 [Vigna unguiculata]|uniref:Uncharacterized protein n=1 Tax=Vigna unguiculata TaxID=3917 RepID=A0A4D6LED8_VIGUN|nr:hypothetical protein DEO72_LG3g1367 [Vigna unguiculata]